ncbi:MAG: DUF4491 family protein [Clostridiales Family XIII bacterium]|jgi:uncharacterized membrane protein YuzA (DUF378 family)|nr:DUF4491 family protein [Clostridiales Family XIII bacterium]
MHINGLIIGIAALLSIGLFHPIVIKCEYHFSERIWPLFLAAGLALLAVSCLFEDVTASAVIAIVGFSCIWSIVELKHQTKRVEKGWFPSNPKRAQQGAKAYRRDEA